MDDVGDTVLDAPYVVLTVMEPGGAKEVLSDGSERVTWAAPTPEPVEQE